MNEEKRMLFEAMHKVTGMPLNENIETNKYNISTVREPIIPDIIQVISQNSNAIEFTNKQSFDEFANQQKYFSASASHVFYSVEEKQEWSRNGGKYSDPDSEQSVLVFETGHKPVQVWDNKNSIGYVVPSESLRETINYPSPEEYKGKVERIKQSMDSLFNDEYYDVIDTLFKLLVTREKGAGKIASLAETINSKK